MFGFSKEESKYICKDCGEVNYESRLFKRTINGVYYSISVEEVQRMCPCGSRNVVLLEKFLEGKVKDIIKNQGDDN